MKLSLYSFVLFVALSMLAIASARAHQSNQLNRSDLSNRLHLLFYRPLARRMLEHKSQDLLTQ